jgi:hypothetical protein
LPIVTVNTIIRRFVGMRDITSAVALHYNPKPVFYSRFFLAKDIRQE